MKRRMLFVSLLVALLAAGLIGTTAVAEETQNEPEAAVEQTAKAEPEAETHVIFAGMQVALDEHGRLRQPTAEESAELSKAMQKMYGFRLKSGQRIPLKNGSNAVAVGPEHWKSTVVTIGEDGKVGTECVTGTDATRAEADHQHADGEQ